MKQKREKLFKTIFLMGIIVLSAVGLVIVLQRPYALETVTKTRLVSAKGNYNEYTDYFYIVDFAETENHLYVCGYKTNPTRLFLTKFDINGTVEWYRTFNATYGFSYNQYAALITVDSSGYVYILTTRNPTQQNESGTLVLLKFAPNSTQLWEKDIGSLSEFKYFYTLTTLNDNTLLIVTYEKHCTIVLIDLATNGTTVWEQYKDIGDSYTISALRTVILDNSIYLLAVKKLIRWPWDKSLIFARYSSANGQEKLFKTLDKPYDVSVALECFKYSSIDNRFIILFSNNTIYKISSDGQIKLRNNLPSVEFYYYSYIAVNNKNGEMYVVRPEAADIYFLKLDKSLNTLYEYTISFNSTDNMIALGHYDSLFIRNNNLYLLVSVGKMNYHIWPYYLILREHISPVFIALSITLSGLLIASTVLLLYEKKILFKSSKS